MVSDKMFIVTENPETYALLKHAGLEELNFNGKYWYFVNSDRGTRLEFAKLDDVHFTDVLTFNN